MILAQANIDGALMHVVREIMAKLGYSVHGLVAKVKDTVAKLLMANLASVWGTHGVLKMSMYCGL